MLMDYKDSLHGWKVSIIYCEMAIVGARLLSQQGVSLQMYLQFALLVLSIVICRRSKCENEAKFYILMTLTQIYLLAFNSAKWIFQNIASYQSFLVQNFKNSYKVWGYSFQFLFKILALIVIWRVYQLSLMVESQESSLVQFSDE